MKIIIILLIIVLLSVFSSCCKKTTEVNYDTVATPVFSPSPYMYNPGQMVYINCDTPGAVVRYSTDGYYTSENSKLYTGPIQIDSTTTIKAIAFKKGLNPSALATGNYAIYHTNFYEMQYISHISATPDTVYADNGVTSSIVSVKVVDEENFGVPGQLVQFETSMGHINASSITDSTGIARATYTAGDDYGIAQVCAVMRKYHSGYPEFEVCADTAFINITVLPTHPELERYITSMTASPETIYADNGITWSDISVTVKDGNNAAVSGQLVQFYTSLGHILHSVTTNASGVANSVLWDDDITGVAEVTAIVRYYDPENLDVIISGDTATVNVAIITAPTDVYSIQFMQTGQIDLNVINTGGVNSFIARVKLYNYNGVVITEPKHVWFKILNHAASGGANLDNHAPGDSVLAISNNGIAQVTLYSGTVPATLIIKASCTDNGHYVETVKDNIVIHAGPAHRIVPFAGGYNTGENLGGGLWRIIAGAMCYDIYDNPVSYGTSVWFYLPSDILNCQIGANAYVGNESAWGDSTAGVAYTTLVYSGIYTFESIIIRAVSGGYNGQEVSGQATLVLPLNQPQLELEVIPSNIVFHGNTNPVPASATALLNVSLFDIQGCAIHNARIIMTSTHGTFEYTVGTNIDPLNHNLEESPNIIVTDWYDPNAVYDPAVPNSYTDVPNPNGQDGQAQGLIRFYAWEIPYGDPQTGTPGITIATITARILGTNVIGSGSIYLLRYPI